MLAGGDMLGIARSADGGRSWVPATGLPSYEVSSFSWHPTRRGEVWAGTMSGPVVSRDGGVSWASARAGLPPVQWGSYSAPVQKVLVDPSRPDRLLAFGGNRRGWASPKNGAYGAVWESLDDGLSWTQRGAVPNAGNIADVERLAGSGDLLAVVSGQGVLRSVDDGASWTAVAPALRNLDPNDIATSPTEENVWWAATAHGPGGWSTPGGLYRTHDAGVSFADTSNGLPHRSSGGGDRTNYTALEVSPSSPTTLYVSDIGYYYAGVARSGDGGLSWSRVLTNGKAPSPYSTGASAQSLAVDPGDGGHVLVGTQEALLQTGDSGRSWSDIGSTQREDGRWQGNGFSGLVSTAIAVDPTTPGHLLLSAMDGGAILHSRDGGASWSRPNTRFDGWGGAYDITFGPGGTAYALLGQAGDFNGVARSTDGGDSWAVASGSAAGLPDRGSRPGDGGAVVALGHGRVLATVGGQLYRSSDTGKTWTKAGPSNGAGDLAVAAATVYLTTSSGVQRSSDGGGTWTLLPGTPGGTAGRNHLTVDPSDPRTVYLTSFGTDPGGLWRLDGGSRWTKLHGDGQDFAVAVDPASAQHLVLARNDHPFHDVVRGGLSESFDGGASWATVDASLPMHRASAVAFDPTTPGRLLVGTFGQGFWSRPAPGRPTVAEAPVLAAASPLVQSASPVAAPNAAASPSAAASSTAPATGQRAAPHTLSPALLRLLERWTPGRRHYSSRRAALLRSTRP